VESAPALVFCMRFSLRASAVRKSLNSVGFTLNRLLSDDDGPMFKPMLNDDC
jgi:hypothetical protein